MRDIPLVTEIRQALRGAGYATGDEVSKLIHAARTNAGDGSFHLDSSSTFSQEAAAAEAAKIAANKQRGHCI